jgi:hypothetical protein
MRYYTMATADEALDASFRAGALSVCPKHGYNMIRSPDTARKEAAHKIAAAKIEGGLFSSELSVLMQAIDDMIAMAQDECQCCANARAYRARHSNSCTGAMACPCPSPTCPKHTTSHIPDWTI